MVPLAAPGEPHLSGHICPPLVALPEPTEVSSILVEERAVPAEAEALGQGPLPTDPLVELVELEAMVAVEAVADRLPLMASLATAVTEALTVAVEAVVPGAAEGPGAPAASEAKMAALEVSAQKLTPRSLQAGLREWIPLDSIWIIPDRDLLEQEASPASLAVEAAAEAMVATAEMAATLVEAAAEAMVATAEMAAQPAAVEAVATELTAATTTAAVEAATDLAEMAATDPLMAVLVETVALLPAVAVGNIMPAPATPRAAPAAPASAL